MESEALYPLMRSGEFATLCNTTKETLRHYDHIGLLQPVMRAGNGYKMYSPLQLTDFLLITALQNSGCSLEEIGGYLLDPDNERLQALMERQVLSLKAERERLLRQQLLLENTISRYQALDAWKHCDTPYRLEECEPEYYSEVDLSDFMSIASESEEASNKVVETVFEYLLAGIGSSVGEMQGTYRIGLDALLRDAPEEDFHLCVQEREGFSADGAVEKPAGIYFKMLYSGSVKELVEGVGGFADLYQGFFARLEELGYRPVGDLYERDLSLFSGNLSETVYSEMSIMVEANEE